MSTILGVTPSPVGSDMDHDYLPIPNYGCGDDGYGCPTASPTTPGTSSPPGHLPVTGASLPALIGFGLCLLILGAVYLAVWRWRHQDDSDNV